MTSKRTAWKQMPRQLRTDPELAKKIQEIAAANFRSVQGQILMWIYEGVNQEKVIKSGELGIVPLEIPHIRELRDVTPDQQRTYRIWNAMKHRCKSAAYKHHAGKGIRVCERWQQSFNDFLADMGPCPAGKSIDRINNDGNYEPGNCRWATPMEQTHNRRNSAKHQQERTA